MDLVDKMFSGLIGNQNQRSILERLASTGRVPHSLLFAGPEGVGKKLFALRIAMTLTCVDKAGALPCGKCSGCIRAANAQIPEASDKNRDAFKKVIFTDHPDVGIISAYKRLIVVDAIREMEAEANKRPFEARGRLFVIDDADKMNDAAANALLKTLEEPPPTTGIILITSRPDSLLPTIRSRCQIMRFVPVDRNETADLLASLGRLSRTDADLAAAVSGGSVGKAVSFDAESFREQRDRMRSVVEAAFIKGDVAGLLRTSELMNDAKNKDNIELALDTLELLLQDVWALKYGYDASRVRNIDIYEELKEIAGQTDKSRLVRSLEDIEEMKQNFIVNINKKIAFDALFMKMAV